MYILQHFFCIGAYGATHTVVWEIFVRDNLVVKFIRCVIFSWVTYTHENILPSNLFALNNFYLRNTCHYAKKIT